MYISKKERIISKTLVLETVGRGGAGREKW